MDVKEPTDVETSAQHKNGGHDHLVLIPQPSTHPRDPLVLCPNLGDQDYLLSL